MTAKGVIGPLRLSREAAEIVGKSVARHLAMILRRAVKPGYSDARLKPQAAAAKLLKSSRRKGQDADVVSVATLTRDEALALYYSVVICLHHNTEYLLSEKEKAAMCEVLHELALLLGAKPGPERLSRADAEYVVDSHQQRESLPDHRIPPDPAQAARLERRLAKEDAQANTLVVDIPYFAQRLSKKNYR